MKSGIYKKLYNYFNRDVKEFNKYVLSIICIAILSLAGFLSYKINTSYALFTDKIEGKKTIVVTVDNCSANKPNKPNLDTNMIPVYYDETTETWKKADEENSNNNWYDYCNKKWANSVTVSSTNRAKYLSAENGTTIPMDDILTMQVWIPRYKYKVWNYNADGTKSSNPQPIKITFEKGTAKTGEITCEDKIQGENGDGTSETCKLKATNETCTDSACNNKTYTHPAFTFGEEEIEGFWIGKFELTGTISDITTKPNSSSLREQTVSSFETNIMNMKNSGNSYGFNTSTDTHMIKNMEWGAVAYLSHSKYGTCTNGTCSEVGINNNSGLITGCGAEAGSASSTTCNEYNTGLGKGASTTGNIYGVYDMSGGAEEYIMANIIYEDGKYMESYFSGYSGYMFIDRLGDFVLDNSGISYPDDKYYDKYSYSTSYTTRKRSKLGDGIKEAYKSGYGGWYSDRLNFANYDDPWFLRGGRYSNGLNAGLFWSNGDRGSSFSYNSSRFIITP